MTFQINSTGYRELEGRALRLGRRRERHEAPANPGGPADQGARAGHQQPRRRPLDGRSPMMALTCSSSPKVMN